MQWTYTDKENTKKSVLCPFLTKINHNFKTEMDPRGHKTGKKWQ